MLSTKGTPATSSPRPQPDVLRHLLCLLLNVSTRLLPEVAKAAGRTLSTSDLSFPFYPAPPSLYTSLPPSRQWKGRNVSCFHFQHPTKQCLTFYYSLICAYRRHFFIAISALPTSTFCFLKHHEPFVCCYAVRNNFHDNNDILSSGYILI